MDRRCEWLLRWREREKTGKGETGKKSGRCRVTETDRQTDRQTFRQKDRRGRERQTGDRYRHTKG